MTFNTYIHKILAQHKLDDIHIPHNTKCVINFKFKKIKHKKS